MSGTTENQGFARGYKIDSALSQYAVVLQGTEEGHAKAPEAQRDGTIAGVLQYSSSASGDQVSVMKTGYSKVIASEAIPKGTQVAINDIEGRVYDPTVWASGDGVVGTLEEVATASGDIVECWLDLRTLLG